MARILVTAATGRVGAALVPHLVAEGHAVRAVTRRAAAATALGGIGADAIVADIRQPETLGTAIESVDAVFLATADDPQQHRIEQALIGRSPPAAARMWSNCRPDRPASHHR